MSVLQHNPNGSHYCHDCGNIVILFDDDIHECHGRDLDNYKRPIALKRGSLEMRRCWLFIDHDNESSFVVDSDDGDDVLVAFINECETKYPTPEDDDG